MLNAFRKRKALLKRFMDRTGTRLWMGPPPALVRQYELEAGDVLFCAPRPSTAKLARWLSEMIQMASDGIYTHCAIYLGAEMIAEAVPKGVRITSLEEFESRYDYIAVTRCPGMNPSRARAIRLYAGLCEARASRYNFLGALLVPFREYLWLRHYYEYAFKQARKKKRRFRKFGGKGLFFCSEFIVQCFKACGYIPRDDRYFASHVWSPTGLAEENIFTLVGYRTWNRTLRDVRKDDPFLGGCHYVLQRSRDYC